MPRKARTISSTDIYHIILRSINQHIIFEEDMDYQKFLFFLLDGKRKYDIDLYAYCLMDNHIHLLMSASPNDLSSFFQSVGTRFVRWYNNKYSRSGHLFQDRFHSVAVENASQYLATLVYIHDNPVKAGICRYPSEYRWSSYNAFFGQKNSLINISHSYGVAGSKDHLQTILAADHKNSDDVFSEIHNPSRHFLTDEQALPIFRLVTQLASTSEVISLTKTQRNAFIRELYQKGLTHKQIGRLMDVSISTIKRVLKEQGWDQAKELGNGP